MTIHYIRHVPYETPGHITDWADRHELDQTRTDLFQNHTLPEPAPDDLVIVLGGPMSIYQVEDYPWLSREKKFLKECLQSGIKTIGICLGAQLIADQLGADVYPMEEHERGWSHVTWTDTAMELPLFQHIPKQHAVFHWHGDTYSLPDGSLHLAKSEHCEQQAFLVPDLALGLQFHLEITRSITRALIDRAGQNASSKERPKETAHPRTTSFRENHERLNILLDKFIE